LQVFGRCVAEMKMVTIADIEEVPLEVLERPLASDRHYLIGLELLHKALVLYLWLSYRFVNVFKDREMAFYAKSLCEEKINRCLLEFSANPALRKRLQKMKDTGAAKAEAEVGSIDEPTSNENMGAEEELLDQSFATEENIDQPTDSSEETGARPPLPSEESPNQPALPVAWNSAGPLTEGANQQDTEGPRYASAHG
jgi:ATP-dependent RNA helicase SUPV3L1/SUV3